MMSRYLHSPFVQSLILHTAIVAALWLFSSHFAPQLPPPAPAIQATLVTKQSVVPPSVTEEKQLEDTTPREAVPPIKPNIDAAAIAAQQLLADKKQKAKEDNIAKEKAMKEQKAKEDNIAKEKAMKEQKAKEDNIAKEKAIKEQKAKEDKIAKDKAIKEQKAKEDNIAKDKAIKEQKAKEDNIAKEKAMKEQKAKEDNIAKEKAMKEQKAKEDKIAKENAIKEQKAKEDNIAKDKAEREAAARKSLQDALKKNNIDNEMNELEHTLKADKTKQLQKEAALAAQKEANRLAEQQARTEQQIAAKKAAKDQEDLVNKYKQRIHDAVYNDWPIPPKSANFSAQVRIVLLPDGEVRSILFLKRSGNNAFDASIEAAIKKASPLPVPSDATLFNKLRSVTFNFSGKD